MSWVFWGKELCDCEEKRWWWMEEDLERVGSGRGEEGWRFHWDWRVNWSDLGICFMEDGQRVIVSIISIDLTLSIAWKEGKFLQISWRGECLAKSGPIAIFILSPSPLSGLVITVISNPSPYRNHCFSTCHTIIRQCNGRWTIFIIQPPWHL